MGGLAGRWRDGLASRTPARRVAFQAGPNSREYASPRAAGRCGGPERPITRTRPAEAMSTLPLPDDRPRTALQWDYAPAPEATDHLRLRERYDLFIGGAWTPPVDGDHVPSLNPATEEPLAEVAFAGAADVD